MISDYSETQKTDNAIIKVNNLSVTFDTIDGKVQALTNVDFEIKEGEILGIIGESGSGKSTLALSLMSLLPDNANVEGNVLFYKKVVEQESEDESGEEAESGKEADDEPESESEAKVHYVEEEVTSKDHSGRAYFKIPRKFKRILDLRLSTIRWNEISMVFQGAMNSLNPVYTVKRQLREVFVIHEKGISYEEMDQRISESADAAGFNKKFLDSYPHQLSGGMKQRAVITMALALDPQLIIADEPTTGLDVITQAKIIRELKRLREEGKIRSMVIISHDVGVVSQLADRVAVLYAGKIMELGKASEIFLKPGNPYSKALMESYPSIRATRKIVNGIPGAVPDLLHLPKGCFFAGRCFYAKEKCHEETPPLVQLSGGHFSLCHFAEDFHGEVEKIDLNEELTANYESAHSSDSKSEVIMETKDLSKFFQLSASAASRLYSRGMRRTVRAVDNLSFEVSRKQVIGIVGESGSGKTTLGRTVLLAIPPTSGGLFFNFGDKENNGAVDISSVREKDSIYKLYRRKTQLIFQDPYDSLNPKMSILDIVSEPVISQRKYIAEDGYLSEEEIVDRVQNALSVANLNPPLNYMNRYPHELSGGERQRVSIARSLVLRPQFLVADEPISMLDVSIRANIMNLLIRLKDEFGMSIVYISHDIASARYVSDRLLVMYLGVAVEFGNVEEVINNPLHPYTKALIQAVPTPDPNWSSGDLKIIGEVGNSVDVPEGCRFFDRCVYRKEICENTTPPRKEVGSRYYICHFEQHELVENPPEEIEAAKEIAEGEEELGPNPDEGKDRAVTD